MKTSLRHFQSSLIVTCVGLLAGFTIGYLYTQTLTGALESLFLTAVLAVLEISLSFDNAVVNASVLRKMNAVWRQRFITWGILLAVVGMRIVFPLAVVSIAAHVSPWQALILATLQPKEYAQVMLSAHLPLAGFGSAFLLMVALNFFFNENKKTHWLPGLEKVFAKLGRVEAVALGLALLLYYLLARYLPTTAEQVQFLNSAILGLITFLVVDGISAFLQVPESGQKNLHRNLHRTSAALFIYLEVLDASFSFDGVVGAFALTNNLFIIIAGLGIGAMFVRSLTLLLVERQTLDEFEYLEHGAFYAIGALAVIMVIDVFHPVPEVVTGLVGAVIIAIAFLSSVLTRPS